MDPRTVGVLGGGQLGRMMAEAAHRLGIKLAVLDPLGKVSPAGQVAELAVEGSFRDAVKIDTCACGTHIPLPCPSSVFPPQHGVRMPQYMDTPTVASVREAGRVFGYPLMLKAKRMAYDGRGNSPVMAEKDIEAAFDGLGGEGLYVEEWVDFEKELAIMVVRGREGEVSCYPVVDTVQKDNVCHTTFAPARVSPAAAAAVEALARLAVGSLWGAGIFGVELFLGKDGTILLNEIAPR
ncbi:unnamed protein product, partial [Choristocarpus tenellus]